MAKKKLDKEITTAKHKLSKAAKLLGGSEPPSKEQTDSTLTELSKQNQLQKVKRIPFTTSINPSNRAYLEDQAFKRKKKVADILNEVLSEYFKDTEQSEFYKAYLNRLKP